MVIFWGLSMVINLGNLDSLSNLTGGILWKFGLIFGSVLPCILWLWHVWM